MFIPKYWSRAADGSRIALGWSESSAADAENMARARLAKLVALGEDETPSDWDYYPSTPVKEEILETPRIAAGTAVITRNRAGAQVLNTDRVAFVDIDLPSAASSILTSIGALFRKRAPAQDSPESTALARIQAWTDQNGARLRAYRTARGLRLIRMDRLLDPEGEECERMFAELGADPMYGRLCRIQKSFRARLTPKPRRVGCSQAPGGHPRTDMNATRAFTSWLADYERASAGKAVCALVAEYGSAVAAAAAQSIVQLHDQRTILSGGTLA